MPGLFSVPFFIKVFTTCIRLTIFDPNFHSLATQDKMVYLLVSFLVPISVPSKHKKRMLKTTAYPYFYSMLSAYSSFSVPWSSRTTTTSIFSKIIPEVSSACSPWTCIYCIDLLFLLVICFLLVTVASLLIYLATASFHPLTSLFKPPCSPVVSDVAASKV